MKQFFLRRIIKKITLNGVTKCVAKIQCFSDTILGWILQNNVVFYGN